MKIVGLRYAELFKQTCQEPMNVRLSCQAKKIVLDMPRLVAQRQQYFESNILTLRWTSDQRKCNRGRFRTSILDEFRINNRIRRTIKQQENKFHRLNRRYLDEVPGQLLLSLVPEVHFLTAENWSTLL